MQDLLPWIVATIVFLSFLGITNLLMRHYVRVPTNRIDNRVGLGGTHVARGRGVFVFPVVHRYGVLPTDSMPVRVDDWQFTVAVGESEEAIHKAAARLLDKDPDDDVRLARVAIAGTMQGATVASDAAMQDDVELHIRESLAQIGLESLNHGPADR